MENKLSGKQSLSLSKLNCKIKDFCTEVLDLVDASSKGELYAKFVKRFLTYIPVDYRSKDKMQLFGDFTHEAYDFFLKKPNGITKIDILEGVFKNNPAITILVSSENRPFTIDSLNSLVSNLALQTIFTFHPVITAIRDENGTLKDIDAHARDGVAESLVYIKALGSFSKEELETIKFEINRIMDLVDYTYDSWQSLLNKLISITTNIVHNKDVYDDKNLPAEETLDFLNWLQKDNITFLGTADFDVETQKLTSTKGVKEIWQDNLAEISTIIEFSKSEAYSNKLVMLGKINKISPVHRNVLVDYILIKTLDESGNYKSGTIIFGLYGTAIYFQSIKNIPILRGKMNYVLEESDFPINGYNAKKIKNIIESLPRDVLIQIEEDDLYCMCTHMLSSMRSHKLKLFVQQDWSNSFVNIIVFMPRERLTPEVYKEISRYLTDKFNSKIITDYITVVAQNFSHFFTTLAIKDPSKLEFNYDEMERDLVKITTNWSEDLLHKLCEKLGEYEGGVRHKQIESAFPTEYRHKFNAEEAIDDINHYDQAYLTNKVVFNLVKDTQKNEYRLKFYSPHYSLTLSETLPSIENLGFTAINEQSFNIKKPTDSKHGWIYEFTLDSPGNINIPFEKLKQNIEEALEKISEGALVSDILNKMLVLSGFDWKKVKLLRALSQYSHQTVMPYGKEYVQQTLVKHYKYTEKLIDYFSAKHDPNNTSLEQAKTLSKEMKDYLNQVSSSTEDKVLQNIKRLVSAILRTNFYQDNCNKVKEYIGFKFNSKKVPDLPRPLPYAEIFVYSNKFEGIHLRNSKVARGGLRWSDRGEDYRTEVLGLMKSQITKNSVIVPSGSKGGFYINFAQGNKTREEYMKEVVDCYKNFLRGLLDLTDNLVDGKVIQPKNTVIHDDEDPYLVVAADKGTATFSDFANEVAKEYNFWLGDAFASGGSAGYDHKKMGITAKGAWISARSHFLSMGIDIQKEPFTVVGIGDMSGDVFGNGMLLSKYIRLVAAFNHEHIFIDPNPNPASSYEERLRLFTTPRTKWSDYNQELISKGGGVFERSAKIIHISQETRELLGLEIDSISPDNLIRAILKAPVDLLWNGGIGTYVKSISENNFEIGDKANDALRINGNELRAKVVCEGGNLGFSQLGRIEYALNGGILNTDFIDNSAGVDCSDHEVNIKIALNNAVKSEKISTEERNKLLEQMTPSVEDLVLVDNYDQNLAITLLSRSPALNIESFGQLISELEKEGLLDRKVEFLPDKSELSRKAIAKEGMTRPELSVILSYSKMSLDAGLSGATFVQDDYFKKYLYNYFPLMMREKFVEEIDNHPLRNEIIRTVVCNKLINQIGGPVISSIKSETGGSAFDIARAHAVVNEVFGLDSLWQQIIKLDKSISMNIKVEMLTDLIRITRRGITWFIRNIKAPINISENVEIYSKQTSELIEMISQLLVGDIKTRFFTKIEHFTSSGVDQKLAKSIATMEVLVSAFDIIFLAKKTKTDKENVANLYFECGDLLHIDWLRQSCEAQIDQSFWNRLSVQSLKDDFYDKQRRLVKSILSSNDRDNFSFKDWIKNNESDLHIFTKFVEDIKSQESLNLNTMILANKKLDIFLRKLEVN
jgi:glutamate dehydrogenase